jgi:Phage integrase family
VATGPNGYAKCGRRCRFADAQLVSRVPQPTAKCTVKLIGAGVGVSGCSGAWGFKLANDGVDTRSLQAYLGHRNIQNTTRYTALAPDPFKGCWRD